MIAILILNIILSFIRLHPCSHLSLFPIWIVWWALEKGRYILFLLNQQVFVSKRNPNSHHLMMFLTCSDSLLNYARKISTLDRLVKRMVFEELGVQKYFNSHVETSFYTMRINKYAPANTEEEERLETRPHLDKSFLTILQQNQVNGLRVQTKEGEWCKVSFTSPSSFIVLVGESFVVSTYFYRQRLNKRW